MTAKELRNPSLLFAQILLWLIAVSGLLSPLTLPSSSASGRLYWITLSTRVAAAICAGIAALLVRRRQKAAFLFVGGLAAWAVLVPVLTQRVLPTVPLLVWGGVIALLVINRSVFADRHAA